MADYLHPIADREPLAWILAHQRTAVGVHRRREAERLGPGDRIFLYTTRGCYRNPTRDRGRIIGVAHVVRRARMLDEPVRFGQRDYLVQIPLKIESLALRGEGVELVPLLDRLESFPNRRAWAAYLRRALVPLTSRDGDVIAKALELVAHGYHEVVATYTN